MKAHTLINEENRKLLVYLSHAIPLIKYNLNINIKYISVMSDTEIPAFASSVTVASCYLGLVQDFHTQLVCVKWYIISAASREVLGIRGVSKNMSIVECEADRDRAICYCFQFVGRCHTSAAARSGNANPTLIHLRLTFFHPLCILLTQCFL